MRIETWDIKVGQHIIIRESDGDTTLVQVTKEPFEVNHNLYVNWQIIQWKRNEEYKGIARWNEDENIWYATRQLEIAFKENYENRNMGFKKGR